ncbi:hypothetical protein QU593_10525 [Rossellomorea marisflavi]|uniref:hypothetical protein n=1 Tax=Rossellomorea marisflavi TaxID=189381 RepID=UPI0025B09935|nr:hypothetical protein [Rossellomorea marisflavi]WJV20841.1 hypothetical protein QU593_10525 [Rossellomorea marisflavi]
MSKIIDGDKLVQDMDARMKNLQQLVDRDMGGDTSHIYSQYWELKWWKEYIERLLAKMKGD